MMLAVLWLVFIATMLSGRMLLILGIYPRKIFGLSGVIFSPFFAC